MRMHVLFFQHQYMLAVHFTRWYRCTLVFMFKHNIRMSIWAYVHTYALYHFPTYAYARIVKVFV